MAAVIRSFFRLVPHNECMTTEDVLERIKRKMQPELSDFRKFIATAPLPVVAQVIEMWRLMNRLPPPAPEQRLGTSQWTALWQDETQSIRLIEEQNAVQKTAAQSEAFKATNDRAQALRDLRLLEKNKANETRPEVLAQMEAKEAQLRTAIEKHERTIAEALGIESPEREWLFPIKEIN